MVKVHKEVNRDNIISISMVTFTKHMIKVHKRVKTEVLFITSKGTPWQGKMVSHILQSNENIISTYLRSYPSIQQT